MAQPAPAPQPVAPAASSAWSPLRHTLFRSVWIATIASNVGTYMQDVGAGWLMTSLSSSPALVALVEAADSIPVMLLAMPAGAMADIVDRRRLLIGTQIYLMIVTAILGVLTLTGAMSAWLLLGFIFVLGLGSAMMMPAWSAIVPDLVPSQELSAAVGLNSVAVNISRAVGPAIAGVLVAAVGPWLVFVLNALSYVGIIAVLMAWKHEHRKSTLPAERFLSAIRMGLRFVMHTRPLQAVLIRGVAFFVFASATWSLFPLVVRNELRRGPEIYGLLLTCIGIGAVSGAILLPRVRARFSRDVLVAGASVLYALAALVLGYSENISLLIVAMLATGVAWIAILAALQVSAQTTLPPWVRARGLAAFVVAFMGGMAFGSILWGQVATRYGIPYALSAAATGMVIAATLTWRFKLGQHELLDFTPAMDIPLPVLAETPETDLPVMVSIRYTVQSDKRAEFVEAMQAVREMRRRNGAYLWQLFHDSENPTRYVEVFMDESWIEHLRQHERASVADREVLNHAKVYLVKGTSTQSSHWLGDREN
nr:Transmembrane secretion effector [uncultured bacterium]